MFIVAMELINDYMDQWKGKMDFPVKQGGILLTNNFMRLSRQHL